MKSFVLFLLLLAIHHSSVASVPAIMMADTSNASIPVLVSPVSSLTVDPNATLNTIQTNNNDQSQQTVIIHSLTNTVNPGTKRGTATTKQPTEVSGQALAATNRTPAVSTGAIWGIVIGVVVFVVSVVFVVVFRKCAVKPTQRFKGRL